MNDIVDKAKKKIGPPPIWFMRQAGRYLPEYLVIRKTENSFLDLCYSPQKVVSITMQPLRRYKLDAAIIFSDILILPHALGVDIEFKENIGPVVSVICNEKQLLQLGKNKDNLSRLSKVYEAISIVKNKINKTQSLIGFAGSPWTVATYLLDDKDTKQIFQKSKSSVWQNKALMDDLMDILIQYTVEHLKNQIVAGATVIKLFDSWAGALVEEDFYRYVILPTQKIVKELKKSHPTIPIIGFPKGAGYGYNSYIELTGIDIIAVDQFTYLKTMKEWQKKIIVQGNLDPVVLLTNKETITRKIDYIFENLTRENYIFNLGHGVLPNTPIENVEFLIECIHEKWK